MIITSIEYYKKTDGFGVVVASVTNKNITGKIRLMQYFDGEHVEEEEWSTDKLGIITPDIDPGELEKDIWNTIDYSVKCDTEDPGSFKYQLIPNYDDENRWAFEVWEYPYARKI